MALKRLVTFNANHDKINRLMDNLNYCLNPIVASEIIDGVLVKEVSLNTGTNSVAHQLGRKPNGWIIVRKNNFGDVYENSVNNTPNQNIILVSSANLKCDFWFF
jgi:hypothetical protein